MSSPFDPRLLVPLLIAVAAPALAQIDPHLSAAAGRHAEPLPYFDARLADGETRDFVRDALDRARTPEMRRARAYDLARLATDIAGVAVDDDEFFGTPHFVRSTRRLLTPPLAAPVTEPRRVIGDFIGRYPALFEVTPGELAAARVKRDFVTRHDGMRHLTYQQQIDGIDVFGCEIKASLSARGELINVSSTMLPLARHPLTVLDARLDPSSAIRAAAANIGTVLTAAPEPRSGPVGASRAQTFAATPDFRAGEDIDVELVYFPRTRTDVRPAWSFALPEIGIGNTYEMLVDAATGEVLRRWNRLHFLGGTQPITFRVYTSDSPAPGSPGTATPNGFQFPFVPRALVTVSPAEVSPFSPNHWIDDGGNQTLGNNVDAHLDLNADDVADLPRPQGVPARTFDLPLDVTQEPSTYRDAVVTQLFYLCNRFHDRLYALGFDEAAGNFQQINFGLEGLGGDRVQADAQDGLGTNNANFDTSGRDGQTARMQMYVFDPATPDRDGDLDADLVYHEGGHGVSLRLLEGTVVGHQSGGMGEGWSDFFAVALSAEPTDDPNASYAIASYSALAFLDPPFDDNYYSGIRRFPYSTNPNVNPQTFADIDSAQQSYPPAVPRNLLIGNGADEVHNVGEVWCNALLLCRAKLWSVYGFAANELVLQLVVDGMKLSPSNPNFLQARDAILQGDLVANGGANLGLLWQGFAERGMGFSAISPSGTTTGGVVEAFDEPSIVVFSYPNGIPEQLLPGTPTTFQVVVQGLGSTAPIPATGLLHWSVDGAPFTSAPMVQTSVDHYDATLPASVCLDRVRFYATVDATAGLAADPSTAPNTTRVANAYSSIASVFADNFETDQGWTSTIQGASTGVWQRGVPVNDPNWAFDVAFDSDGSGKCFLTGNQFGNFDVDDGAVVLMSPKIDMSAGAVRIRYDYQLYLTIENGVDRLLVEISANDTSGPWTEIARYDLDDGLAWRTATIDTAQLAALGVALTADMRVRFTANDSGMASIVEASIDAFTVEHFLCNEPPTAFCFGDGSLATPCPCAAPNTVPNPSGAANAGCANSFHLGGGRLSVSGGVNPDTIVLTASDLSPFGFTFFVKANAQDAAGTAVGDGATCMSGALVRFGSQNAVAGVATYPNPSLGLTTPLSTLGSTPVGSGEAGYYTNFYRNAAPGFCSPGTSNFTNAYRITWF